MRIVRSISFTQRAMKQAAAVAAKYYQGNLSAMICDAVFALHEFYARRNLKEGQRFARLEDRVAKRA